MRILFILVLMSLPYVALGQDIQAQLNSVPSSQKNEWVVVLSDPRPARLQGWVKGNYGKSSGDYRSSLELKRFAKKVSSKYDMELQDQWFIPSLGVYCLVVKFNQEYAATMLKLKRDNAVQWVQPSNNFKLMNGRKLTSTNTKSHNTTSALSQRLPKIINGKGVIIAIVDSAVDTTHQDLVGSVELSTDFVVAGTSNKQGESHGTAVAGVMVTQRSTKLGIAGVAPDATIEAYRGCWESTETEKTNCNTLSLARALDAVARGNADILNLSLSGPQDALLDRILQRIINRGTFVVAAFDPSRSNSNRFPRPRNGVLIVKASGLDDKYEGVFTAPGARIVASPGNRYDYMHGHSVASAYTSALLALRKQALSSKVVDRKTSLDWRNIAHRTMAEDLVKDLL